MKQFCLLICLISFSVCNAQDPQLFENTWYLYSVQASDLDTEYIVSEIEPRIDPYLIINKDMQFNGAGACNTFTGLYEFTSQNYLTAIDFAPTTEDCGLQQLNSFESTYFGFISAQFEYYITQDGGGNVLSMSTPIFGHAIFKSYPLSTSEFNKNEFQIYPNPARNILVLNSQAEFKTLHLKIFNITGELLNTRNINLDQQASIDVANLSSGIYFLNIETENGRVETKKFVKE